ncbi:hypothetical protein QBC46DRAFT_139677 [Diplogelasinospora grovesii]|uniref:Uncharacterized protein n=1 Tax=Diplogelasinospora grovesii TaxID=303347 RepID=A0AAN6N625_9PEZI|nr:hypothetical protein QBC46DRAFT_139677 [Diplogelasinospora grovesii]
MHHFFHAHTKIIYYFSVNRASGNRSNFKASSGRYCNGFSTVNTGTSRSDQLTFYEEERAASDIWLQKLNAAKIRFDGELPPKGSGPFGFSATQEDNSDAMEIWRKGIYARVSRQHQREALPSAIGDASAYQSGIETTGSIPSTNEETSYAKNSQRSNHQGCTNANTEAFPSRPWAPSNPDMLGEL